MKQNTLTVTTPGLTFFCRTWGESDGIPLLLLHGSYATGRWWERFAAELPDEIYAIAPDLRGCGGSEKPAHGYSIPEQADDLLALSTALALDDFHLMAHSSSAAIAVDYALHSGHTLSTLTLVSPVPMEGVITPLDGYLLLEQMKQDSDLLTQAMAMLMPSLAIHAAGGQAADQALLSDLVKDAQQMAPAAFIEVARSLGQWNRFVEARQLTLPTLLVWGDNDMIVDRDAMTRTLIAIPGANNLEVLRGVGHSPMLEAPHRLADLWLNFILQDFDHYNAVRDSI